MTTRRRPRRTVHRRAAPPSPISDAPAPIPAAHPDIPSASTAPLASVAIATSGIHPITSRLVAIAVEFYSQALEPIGNIVRVINPGEDIGPWHLHGFTPEDVAECPGFDSILDELSAALSGRTLIMHQTGYTWGFITNEHRRAQRSANRARRARARTQPPLRTPTFAPAEIIDTLATARRQSIECYDSRLRAIVDCYNEGPFPVDAPASALPELGAVASEKRGQIPPTSLLRADAQLTMSLYTTQLRAAGVGAGHIDKVAPDELVADQFGIRRSKMRVDAANAPRPHENPGVLREGGKLVQGMEFVISPDVASDPDQLIGKGVAAGLVYSEKLNRKSSLVVCNTNHELRGKAMHAERKNIPLVDDKLFLELLDDVDDGIQMSTPASPTAGVRPATQGMRGNRIPEPQRSTPQRRTGGGSARKSGSNKPGSRGRGKPGSKSSGGNRARKPGQRGENGSGNSIDSSSGHAGGQGRKRRHRRPRT